MNITKKRTRLLSLLLTAVLLLSIALTGCSTAPTAPASSTEAVAAVSSAQAAVTSSTASEAPASATRIVKDSDGKDVEIPSEITKVAPVIGAFSQMTEMLTEGNGKIAAAATTSITDYFKKVFPDYLISNPNNYDSTSVEDIIASGAQVAYGPISVLTDEQRAQLAKAGIPFVAINNIKNVDGMCESFTIIGNILGESASKKAAQFVEYYRGNIEKAKTLTAGIKEEDKVRFLNLRYAADAYSTINKTDICNEYIVSAGGINVAADYVSAAAGTALTVDAELVVKWNPQIIMTSDDVMAQKILADPAFASVDAIKNKQVYVCPYGVYMWSVRSGEGAMMPLWLGTVMYPELFKDVDLEALVRDFFKVYYSYDIPDAEIVSVLAGSAKNGMLK